MSQAQRPPGGTRPGGRTARTRAAVLAAVFEELGNGDYGALTMEKVAQRAGVHLATVYRRWRSVEGLVCDLLVDRSTAIPLPDSGSLHQDLRLLARAIAAFYSEPRHRAMIEAMVSAAARNPLAAQVLHDFFVERLRKAGELVERAVRRREVPADTDPDETVAALGAPFYYRLLIARRPVDMALAESAATATWAAARAGAFPRTRTGPAGESARPRNADGR